MIYSFLDLLHKKVSLLEQKSSDVMAPIRHGIGSEFLSWKYNFNKIFLSEVFQTFLLLVIRLSKKCICRYCTVYNFVCILLSGQNCYIVFCMWILFPWLGIVILTNTITCNASPSEQSDLMYILSLIHFFQPQGVLS